MDGSTTNEIQTLSKSGSTVTLSNSGGSFTDSVNTYTAGSGIDISNNVISAVDNGTPEYLANIVQLDNVGESRLKFTNGWVFGVNNGMTYSSDSTIELTAGKVYKIDVGFTDARHNNTISEWYLYNETKGNIVAGSFMRLSPVITSGAYHRQGITALVAVGSTNETISIRELVNGNPDVIFGIITIVEIR